jgi:D-xylose transport system permease protein
MADTSIASTDQLPGGPSSTFGDTVRALEIDLRIIGMLVALAVIWVGFNIASGGLFLTPRNLWNLSVQTSTVGVMATGMVLVIVTRNIDLSVGSMLGFVGMTMALLQAEILPDIIGFDHPVTWIIAVLAGLTLGGILGGFQGWIVAYVGVPSFIVTLGGLLVWRGGAWALASGRTIAPMDSTFQLLGGGSRGSIGASLSWVVAIVACVGIIALLITNRRRKHSYGFPVRPLWAEIALIVVACGAVLGAVAIANAYAPLDRALGIAYPVLILIVVTIIMTFVATRTKFGRSVFAIGGNPEAAELAGINTRRTVMLVFALMGILVGVGAVITTARLNAAVSGLGTLAELSVIAAAVIGGTSLSGGIGSVPGAVLGALVMQSLVSGMVLIGVDAPLRNIVVGIVLVIAVAINTFYRQRTEQLTA